MSNRGDEGLVPLGIDSRGIDHYLADVIAPAQGAPIAAMFYWHDGKPHGARLFIEGGEPMDWSNVRMIVEIRIGDLLVHRLEGAYRGVAFPPDAELHAILRDGVDEYNRLGREPIFYHN